MTAVHRAVVSWFSGIGGFDLGLARAGWACVGAWIGRRLADVIGGNP